MLCKCVGNSFGGSKWRWLLDAISGYNQIRVATWDGHSNNFCNRVESDIIDTKTPYKGLNVSYVFFMRLGSQEGLRQPSAVKNVTDVPKFKAFSNSLFDDRELTRPKSRVFTGNRSCASCDNLTLIVLNRNCDAFFRKDPPVLFYEVE